MENKVEQTSPSDKNEISNSPITQTRTPELQIPIQTRTSELPDRVEQTSPSVHSTYMPIKEFIKKRRNLPHWQNPNSVYFITFRTFNQFILADKSKQIIYDAILFQDNKKCKIYSFVIMPDHVHIIMQPIEIKTGEYYNLSEIMQAIKGFSAKQIIKNLRTNSNSLLSDERQTGTSVLPVKHIFQAESFDKIIRSEEELFEKMNYFLNNPVKKDLIENGHNYKWYYLNKY